MNKTILIIVLTLVVILIGGGSYYYFEIYQPQEYAISLLSLYQKLEGAGLQPDTSSLKNAKDYENAFKILRERTDLLELIRGGFLRMTAPKRMTKTHEEFGSYVDFLLSQHAYAYDLTSFVKNTHELREAITGIQGGLDQKKIATMGDLQKFWGERVSKIKTSASMLFAKEIKELSHPSFRELKSLWEEASPAFDLVLRRINAMDPHLPTSNLNNLFTPSDTKQLEKYTKKLEEFMKKTEALTEQYSAYDLLAFRNFPGISPAEVSERALRFYQIMQDLKQKYGN